MECLNLGCIWFAFHRLLPNTDNSTDYIKLGD